MSLSRQKYESSVKCSLMEEDKQNNQKLKLLDY